MCIGSGVVAYIDPDVNGSSLQLERRKGENDTSYHARCRAAEDATRDETYTLLLGMQANENNEAYLARLRLTISQLVNLHTPPPEVIQRTDETQASYGARCRAAKRAYVAMCSQLIARPGESATAYRTRIVAQQENKGRVEIARHRDESDASFKARLQALQEELVKGGEEGVSGRQ